ncbi:T9SS type A sorting domain-containing protein [Winogradskyella schleiferi]|uniref:T9SS type A sorting domain-containing protein n=1 Tax=Winogradskyella schleiferi TaxID=2686078 RepID=UPI0015BA211E|nr:T9SS type A sorting domain-containing protein [Winogradskyella schleiferi]
MKNLIFFFLILPFISFSQTQIGADIDGEAERDFSGESVSLSSDGSIVAIGAGGNDGNGSLSGHVRVYENQSGSWVQVGSDIDGEEANNISGWRISLSSDGSNVAIGATWNDGNGSNSGHVRVYENQSGSWIQVGSDIDGEEAGDGSGGSLSLSSDGSILAIGAVGNNGNGISSGHVRVYEKQSGSWVQLGSDIEGGQAGDGCGNSVSLSSDGNIVAIGSLSGHVRVYENQSGNWVIVGLNIDGEEASDSMGTNVSLSSDGSVVAIGAGSNDGNGISSGHVRVYENQSDSWVQVGSDIDGEEAEDFSGESVSLSSDGSIVAIGARGNDGNGSLSGHVRVYKNQSGSWVQIGSDIDGEEAGDSSGGSVSLSSDGSIVAIGARSSDDNGIASGHVRVYDLSDVLSTEERSLKKNFNLYPNPTKKKLTIQLENNLELKNVNIFNNLGQLVLTSKETTIDSSIFSKGLYVVEIETNKGKASKKLIVK